MQVTKETTYEAKDGDYTYEMDETGNVYIWEDTLKVGFMPADKVDSFINFVSTIRSMK